MAGSGAPSPPHTKQIVQFNNEHRLTTNALTILFWRIYRAAGLEGCSSHSGRRSFITMAARRCAEVGASIEDVRELAGHAFLSTTAVYALNSKRTMSEPLRVEAWNGMRCCEKLFSHVQAGNCNPRASILSLLGVNFNEFAVKCLFKSMFSARLKR
jgi:hypothetical protein